MNPLLPSAKAKLLSALIAISIVCGCSKPVAPPATPTLPATGATTPATPPATSAATPTTSPQPLPIPSDPKLAAFLQAIAPYIAEARAAADEIEKVPSVARATEINKSIIEHYAKLPPTPDGYEQTGQIRQDLKNIRDQIKVAEFQAPQQKDIDIKQPMTLFANDIRNFCNRIEKKIAAADKPPTP